MTSETAQRTYDGLPEFYREADTGGLLLDFVESLVDGMGVGDVAEDLATFPDRLLDDQATIPLSWIRWLSQHLGIQFNPGYSEVEQRVATQTSTSGWRSGTADALAAAVRAGIRPYYDVQGFNYLLAEGGHYTSTDINILPADDAHFQQSKGGWTANLNAVVTQSTDVALFGDASLKNTVPAAGISGVLPATYALDASTEYTASIWVRPTKTRNMRMRHTDDGGTTHSGAATYTSCPANEWTQISLTFTTYGGTTSGRMIVETDAGATEGEVIYFDQACVREGADGTFIPSVFIDGDIDVQVRSDAHFGTGESLLDLHDGSDGFALRNSGGSGALSAVIGGGTATSSAIVPAGVFDVIWSRFVAEDNGADKDVTFYTALDEPILNWQALGTVQTIVGASGDPGYGSIATLGVAGPTTPPSINKFVDVIVRDGRDGPIVLHFEGHDVTALTAPTFTDSQEREWAPSGAVEFETYPEEPFVEITRHYAGDIWDIGVTTAAEESPSDTSIIEAAISEAQSKPAGFTVTFATFSRTWTELEAAEPTWGDWVGDTWTDLTTP